jgi:SAM-dependent methyltransferase
VSFEVPADAYTRYMGRFSEPLATVFLDTVGVRRGQRALDVGCGPGALTAVLVERLGAAAVAAVDPSPPFVAAAAERFPDVDVRRAGAEALPFGDDEFDLALAQLVVHFMKDPVAGVGEMARVTRPGGTVAASVWDHAVGGTGPLSPFWDAVQVLDPQHPGETGLTGSREGDLERVFREAGLDGVEAGRLTVTVAFATFEEWWEPFLLGVGPAGDYVAGLHARGVEALRATCADRLPPAPFEFDASAWIATGRA